MQPTAEKPFRLQDFEPFLTRMVEEEQEGAVIGGIAVSAWAETFLLTGEKAKFDLPIYSKDLDLRGHKPVFSALAKEFQNDGTEIRGMAYATRKNAPQMGRVFAVSLIWRGQRTSLKVLERLPGLVRDIDTPPRRQAGKYSRHHSRIPTIRSLLTFHLLAPRCQHAASRRCCE